jgi:uncharacterized damage-inducible protein DinB
MSEAAKLIPEFDQEMASTRRVIERVPGDRGEWRPHPKSFPVGHLTQLVATMPGWITRTIRDPEIDLAQGGGYSFQSTESLLQQFDQHVAEAREALGATDDAAFAEDWSLKMGERTIFTLPRGVVVRQHINHLVHHRGQLTVYLRLLDVPVPSTYGPTADERW